MFEFPHNFSTSSSLGRAEAFQVWVSVRSGVAGIFAPDRFGRLQQPAPTAGSIRNLFLIVV